MNLSEAAKIGWVDRYLLRYGPGTILGGVIVDYFYSRRAEIGIKQGFSFGASESVLVAGCVGFLYCYLASVPILALHYSRALYLAGEKKNKLGSRSGLIAGAVWIACILFLVWRGVDWPIACAVAGGAIFFFCPWVFALGAYGCRKQIRQFYGCVNRARSAPENAGLVESYRTMREHGNAFYIMFWEVVLASVTWVPFHFHWDFGNDAMVLLGMLLLLLWLFPAIFAWFVAGHLEMDLSGYPDSSEPKA